MKDLTNYDQALRDRDAKFVITILLVLVSTILLGIFA